MISMNKIKSNKAFMILSFIGILMVVDTHLCSNLYPLEHIFPVDSFFMPMFVFISGYFFSVSKLDNYKTYGKYFAKKTLSLFVPFILWTVVYGLFVLLMNETKAFAMDVRSFPLLVACIFGFGTSFEFNDPMWFALLLYYVFILYSLCRFGLKKIWNDYIAMAVLMALGAVCIYFTHSSFNDLVVGTLILRVGFYLQFFELGYLFKSKLEKHFNKLNPIIVILMAMVINMVLIAYYGEGNIRFPTTVFMKEFHTTNYFLPLITSITGISFYLTISKLVAPFIGDNKVVNFISNHTFFIMTNHLIFKTLFHAIIYGLFLAGVKDFASFNVEQLRTNPWYVYGPVWLRMISFFFTIIMCLLSCFAFYKIKDKISSIINRMISNKK